MKTLSRQLSAAFLLLALSFLAVSPAVEAATRLGEETRVRNIYTGTWELGDWSGVSATTTKQDGVVIVRENIENTTHQIQQYVDVPDSKSWKISLEVKPVGARNIQIYVLDAYQQSRQYAAVQCGLTAKGSILAQWAGPDSEGLEASVTAFSDGYFKCEVGAQIGTSTGPTRLRVVAYPIIGNNNLYQGDGVSGFLLRSSVLSGMLLPPSCQNKALATCGFVQSLLSMREGFAASTTGGVGGDVVTVTNLNDSGPGSLRAALTLLPSTKPVWVKFQQGLTGSIPLQSPIYIPANRTLDGRNASISVTGRGLYLFGTHGASNNIVNNVTIRDISDPDNDAMWIANDAKDIWIHRVKFAGEGGDELLDISNGAANVTVSWSRFENHDKTFLFNSYPTTVVNGVEVLNGHELDFYDRDKEARVTLHHNVFVGTGQRHPRAIFGKVHMYNNYLSEWGSYGIGSSFRAQTLAEGNVFEHTGGYGAKALLTQVGIDPEPGYARLENNFFIGTAYATSSQPGLVSAPSYQYRCDEAGTVLKTKLLADAGAHVFDTALNTTALGAGCPAVVASPPPVEVWQRHPLGSWTAVNAMWVATSTGGVLTETATNAVHMLQQYLTVPITTDRWKLSFEMKPRGSREMRMYVFDTNNQSTAYLAAQCVPQGAGSIRSSWKGTLSTELSASATPLPEGWYLCSLSGRPNTLGLGALRVVLQLEQAGITGYLGDGVSGADLRNILLERRP